MSCFKKSICILFLFGGLAYGGGNGPLQVSAVGMDMLYLSGETPICTMEDELRPIELIKVGDFVRGCDLKTHTCEHRQVVAVSTKIVQHLLKLTIDGRSFKTADDHLFYVVTQRGYVPANRLQRGDALRSLSGKTVFIQDIEDEAGEFVVYSLQVSGLENYYAGNVLVRNCDFLDNDPGSSGVSKEQIVPIVDEVPPSPRSRLRHSRYQTQGTLERAHSDFQDMARKNSIQTVDGDLAGWLRGQMHDGSGIIVRPDGFQGEPALEIYRPNGDTITFEYKSH